MVGYWSHRKIIHPTHAFGHAEKPIHIEPTVHRSRLPDFKAAEGRLNELKKMAEQSPYLVNGYRAARKKFLGLLEQAIKEAKEKAKAEGRFHYSYEHGNEWPPEVEALEEKLLALQKEIKKESAPVKEGKQKKPNRKNN